MKPASLITIVVAVAAVAIAAVVTRGGGGSSSSDNPAAAEAPKGSLALDMRVSPEKEALLRPLVRRFNASNTRAAGSACSWR